MVSSLLNTWVSVQYIFVMWPSDSYYLGMFVTHELLKVGLCYINLYFIYTAVY